MRPDLSPVRTGAAALGVFLAAAGVDAGEATPLPYADKPIAVDGRLKDAVWDRAKANRVAYARDAKKPVDAKRMRVRYAWDGHFLYIGYEVFDENLVAVGTGVEDGPAANRREGLEIDVEGRQVDVAEFFVSFGDKRFFWELHHNAANQFNDVWCHVVNEKRPMAQRATVRYGLHLLEGAYVKDRPEKLGAPARRLAKAVFLKPQKDGTPSTVNDPSDTDTGYTAELRLPLYGIGAPKSARTFTLRTTKAGKQKRDVPGPWRMSGQRVRILAVVQNGDLEQRYHHSSPKGIGGWFHKSWSKWPVLEFRGGPAAKQ